MYRDLSENPQNNTPKNQGSNIKDLQNQQTFNSTQACHMIDQKQEVAIDIVRLANYQREIINDPAQDFDFAIKGLIKQNRIMITNSKQLKVKETRNRAQKKSKRQTKIQKSNLFKQKIKQDYQRLKISKEQNSNANSNKVNTKLGCQKLYDQIKNQWEILNKMTPIERYQHMQQQNKQAQQQEKKAEIIKPSKSANSTEQFGPNKILKKTYKKCLTHNISGFWLRFLRSILKTKLLDSRQKWIKLLVLQLNFCDELAKKCWWQVMKPELWDIIIGLRQQPKSKPKQITLTLHIMGQLFRLPAQIVHSQFWKQILNPTFVTSFLNNQTKNKRKINQQLKQQLQRQEDTRIAYINSFQYFYKQYLSCFFGNFERDPLSFCKNSNQKMQNLVINKLCTQLIKQSGIKFYTKYRPYNLRDLNILNRIISQKHDNNYLIELIKKVNQQYPRNIKNKPFNTFVESVIQVLQSSTCKDVAVYASKRIFMINFLRKCLILIQQKDKSGNNSIEEQKNQLNDEIIGQWIKRLRNQEGQKQKKQLKLFMQIFQKRIIQVRERVWNWSLNQNSITQNQQVQQANQISDNQIYYDSNQINATEQKIIEANKQEKLGNQQVYIQGYSQQIILNQQNHNKKDNNSIKNTQEKIKRKKNFIIKYQNEYCSSKI